MSLSTISIIILIPAMACFIVDGCGVPVKRIKLISLGLSLWVLAILIGGID